MMPVDSEALAQLCDDLAQAITAAGSEPTRQRFYLAKLVLLLARETGDADRVRALAALALRDLD